MVLVLTSKSAGENSIQLEWPWTVKLFIDATVVSTARHILYWIEFSCCRRLRNTFMKKRNGSLYVYDCWLSALENVDNIKVSFFFQQLKERHVWRFIVESNVTDKKAGTNSSSSRKKKTAAKSVREREIEALVRVLLWSCLDLRSIHPPFILTDGKMLVAFKTALFPFSVSLSPNLPLFRR